MEKDHSNTTNIVQSPFADAVCADLDSMTLDSFKLWTVAALKVFLLVRKRSTEGSFEELAARAYIAWEDQAAVDPSEEHSLRSNLREYKDRLVLGSTVLPDPFTLKEGWLSEQGRVNWPSLYFCDISAYLQMTTPSELFHRLCNEYKQGKSFRYFTKGLCKEVHYHPISDQSHVAFLAAKVTKSFLQKQPHEAWVCVEKDATNKPGGRIYTAYCTCTAGLKGSCNHVVAILFRVEYAVRTGLTKPSSTSQSCVWNVPAADRAPSEPIKLTEQTWIKDQYFKQNDKSHSKSIRQLGTVFSPLSARQEDYVSKHTAREDLADLLRDLAPESCFIQLYDKRPFPTPKKVDCPPSPKSVAISLGHPITPEELAHALLLSEDERTQLHQATVKQHESPEWYEQRIGRITASNFHRVCSRMRTLVKKPQADPKPLIQSLMGYAPQPTTVAIKHGKAMEPHAKQEYHRVQAGSHGLFRSEDSGLFIHRTLPFLGASPDLLVACKCHSKGICEIKCPESIKDQIPSFQNWSHLIEEGGITTLSKSSPYYPQVQGQMAILEIKYCDFFVYTSKGYHLERIMFNREFWEEKQQLLSNFWMKYLFQELIYGSLSECEIIAEESSAMDHTYQSKATPSASNTFTPQPSTSSQNKSYKGPLSKPRLPPVYLCGKCGGNLEDVPEYDHDESLECSKCKLWYHKRCVRLNRLDDVSGNVMWLCFQCNNL